MYEVRAVRNVDELREALALVKDQFYRAYGTFPVEIPEQMLVTVNKDTGKVVAALGVEMKPPGSDKKLEIEDYLDFDFDMISPDVKKSGVGELERWVSADAKVTVYMLLGGFLFNRNMGLGYTCTFQKRKVARLVLLRYKLPLEPYDFPVREKHKNGPYKNYFGADDLAVFIQKTDKLIESVEKNFGYRDDIIFNIPDKITMPEFKTEEIWT